MLDKWNKIKKHLYWIIWIGFFLVLVSFASRKQKQRICGDVHIQIENQLENYFVEKKDVKRLMTNGNSIRLRGLNKEAIDLKELEGKIKQNKFVLKTVVSQALNGDIFVQVKENKPIGRLFVKNKSYYVDKNGEDLPLSINYTARVIVMRANAFRDADTVGFFAKKEGKPYVDLMNYISGNSFWKKQISEIEIDKKGRIILWPLVGKQEIRFGHPEDIEVKFQKLDVFFKKILPHVGWNKYKIVNLEFNNQIVCE